ncbi:unnamed protein product [Phytophthora lilii]|uniref:Unnamed protein product n=1 Tax=Phytophthora lilii TaxID=2077276 RepID=A0A9W6TEY1_9STRA|nr:unnamed protein product [Phytophthora lilii]
MKRAEWIPWAIDQLVKEEQADHPETQHGADSTAFVHRVTDLARGEGLTSIAKVSWSASVGNVHTAAVPPWMVQSEEEYKRCNRREQAAPPPSLPTRPNDKAEGSDKKRRDIFSELQSKTEYGPNWLPNFGGVWQEGPRSKTKQAFRKTVNLAQASRDQPIATTTISQVPERAALQRVPPPKSIQPSPPPPQRLENHRPGPAERTTQLECEIPAPSVSKSSSIEASEDKSKTANSLDAKKQLLLAQKERLRAKMAARRRQ